jgi:AraC family transcriptional regulator of adaptative response / DNA-3-methyladenine glycosylase II
MTGVQLDDEQMFRICRSGDPRFDGWFIIAVTSTGIYCRPSCPSRSPRRENMRFYPGAAAAQAAGFRACKRCRPDASPGSPEWNLRGDAVARAVRLIADGEVDRTGVEGLAARLGYSPRHLNRIFTAELGAGPLAVARAQRAQTARVLIETTSLPFATVAFAAGFSSIRQFNDTVREVFAQSPTELRTKRPARTVTEAGVMRLRLPVRLPFDAEGVWTFLGRRVVPGLEELDGATYRRTLDLPQGTGRVALTRVPDAPYVEAELRLDEVADLAAAVARCRRLLDLDADPVVIDDALAPLGPSGGRVPGGVDGWEILARAIVGQQVTLGSARRTLGRLVARLGARPGNDVFPSAEDVAGLDPADLGLPRARGAALVDAAALVAAGDVDLDPGADRDEVRHRLSAVRGIGPWTVDYVAMRALGDPDVGLDGDVVVRNALARRGLDRTDVDRWRPWRSYAVVRLWADEERLRNQTTTDRQEQHDADDEPGRGRTRGRSDGLGGRRAGEHADAVPTRDADAGRVRRRPAGGRVARRPGRAGAVGADRRG